MHSLIACCSLSMAFCTLASAAPRALTAAEIAARATPSIVLIKVPGGVGTGFAVGTGGRIATNLHVVSGARQATVVAADGREFEAVEVMAFDEEHDLAVLRIQDLSLKALKLGESSGVKAGEHVIAIGHPLGLGISVSDGLVSAVRVVSSKLTVLQISAPISPGSSGSPLFNDRGAVIGISTHIVTGGQNLNFGMPIDALKPLLSVVSGVPLAEFAKKAVRQRNVPTHPLSLLDDCPPEKLRSIVERIHGAIGIGAPLYNDGNYEACYRIYAAVALEAQDSVGACAGTRKALLAGVTRADELQAWDDKAWAMRDAFDGLLDVAQRVDSGLVDGERAAPQGPQRTIPRHPDGFLDGCAKADLAQVLDALDAAIESGAPLYNQGNVEACFRIYEGAIRDLDRKVPACPAARSALHDGLRAARALSDWAAKAWALRDAFDGLLAAIERTTPASP